MAIKPYFLEWLNNFATDCGKTRPANEVRELLHMTECRPINDNNAAATKIREALKQKFFLGKQGMGVC